MADAKEAMERIHAASEGPTAAQLLAENKFLKKFGWKVDRVRRTAPLYAETAVSRRWFPETPEDKTQITDLTIALLNAVRLPLAEWGNPRPISLAKLPAKRKPISAEHRRNGL
jgi:hypothetical protein